MTSGKILKAAVIGWPIKHSRSPMIHSYWLKQYGISGTYEKIPVPPENLEEFCERVSKGMLTGFNVTIPHKEKITAFIQIEDETTRKIGAVNTVCRRGNTLYGLNTDGLGFLMNLKSRVPDWNSEQKRCLILGAGGAAQAIAFTLVDDGAGEVIIANRTVEKAAVLADRLSTSSRAIAWQDIPSYMAGVDLLVNTTSLGMTGQPELPIDLSGLKPDCIVCDIVYTPLETSLLRRAARSGHQTVDGLGMLLFQAAPGFELWFGRKPEVTPALRDLIIADLKND